MQTLAYSKLKIMEIQATTRIESCDIIIVLQTWLHGKSLGVNGFDITQLQCTVTYGDIRI